MDGFIFETFIFCMSIILGVLLLGFFKWLFRLATLSIRHNLWIIKTLSILPFLCLLAVIYVIIFKLIEYKNPEFLIAISIGIMGSYFLFSDD